MVKRNGGLASAGPYLRPSELGMTIGTGMVLLVVAVIAVVVLVALLRPRRPRLVNNGRRPRGFRRRRIEALRRAAAADIALIQGNDGVLGPDAPTGHENRA